jgi:quercetin dioxygenase-like cupin family protein
MSESADPVRLLRQADFTPRWNSPRADEPGYGRAFVEGLAATNFMVNIIVLPPGQGCPRHDFGGDVVVLALTGRVEFVVHGDSAPAAYALEPNDLLLLPAGVSYEYRNAQPEEASFASIAGRVGEWPARARYAGVEGEVLVHAASSEDADP